jgi:hypothetical protein
MEAAEMAVIRQLGQQLGQVQVALLFEQVRLNQVRQAVAALWAMAKPIESGCDCLPPQGYVIPADALITLQSLVG